MSSLQAARRILVACALLWLSVLPVQLKAQTNYMVDWFTVDGGGGTCTGGIYALSASIGQADAGTLTGGDYELVGGFWGLVAAVQTTGAPLLSIALTATNTIVVSWPSPSPGYILQQKAGFDASHWVVVTEVPVDNGAIKSVVIAPPVGNRFYRLSNSVPALRVQTGSTTRTALPSTTSR